MLFIQFEARYGKPRLAKELVLRAIRECPWAKGIYPTLLAPSDIGVSIIKSCLL